jgi:hypothetical protein
VSTEPIASPERRCRLDSGQSEHPQLRVVQLHFSSEDDRCLSRKVEDYIGKSRVKREKQSGEAGKIRLCSNVVFVGDDPVPWTAVISEALDDDAKLAPGQRHCRLNDGSP